MLYSCHAAVNVHPMPETPPAAAQPPDVISDNDADARIQHHLAQDALVKLFPFQLDGVRFGVKHRGRILLADEMGLGKTVQVSTQPELHTQLTTSYSYAGMPS